MGASIGKVEDASVEQHFQKWKTVVERIETLHGVEFPGDVDKATSRKILKFIMDNLSADAACQPALHEELKRQVKEESLDAFHRCFNERGEAIACLEEVEKNLDTSKIQISEVFSPIPVAPPLAPASSSSSSIPAAPPILDSVVLAQVVNPKTNKVEAVVRPTGMQMVDKPFRAAPNSEVVRATPAQNTALLDAIRKQGGQPAKTSEVRRQVEASASLTEDLNFAATTKGPGGTVAVVPVSDASPSQDLLSQIRGGSSGLRKMQPRSTDEDDADSSSGGSVQGQILSKLQSQPDNPLFAAIASRRSKIESEEEDDDDDDDFEDYYAY